MSKKKDVLFLLQFFYPEYVSSATLPFDTAVKLAQEGLSVDVLCGYPHEYTDEKAVPYKETVQRVGIRRVKYLQLDRKKVLGRLINYLSFTVATAFQLFSMRKYRTIVVYSNPPVLPLVATLASKLFRCRLVFVAYDLYPEIALKTNVVSPTSIITKMKDYIVKHRPVDANNVHIIPNWFKDEYHPERSTEDNPFASVTNGRVTIGYFGNMGIAQDMQPIIEAIRHYKDDPEVCFLLAGHGSKHALLQKMIDDEHIENAVLYGFLKGQDYLDALSASHCAVVSLEKGLTGLCVPSKTYGFMMQGLPIVAIMDDGDVVSDVRQGAGYHIADNSATGLIDVIDQIKSDVQGCRAKGEISRKIYLEKYTSDICLGKYVELLKAILSTN